MISTSNVTLRVGKKALFEDVSIKFEASVPASKAASTVHVLPVIKRIYGICANILK